MAFPSTRAHGEGEEGAVATRPPRQHRRRALLAATAIVAGTLTTPAILGSSSTLPFAWIGAAWVVALGVTAWAVPATVVRVISLNAAAAALALTMAETWLWLARPPATDDESRVTYSLPYFVDHPILGYAPRKGVAVDVEKVHREGLVYRARYSIDADGLRRSPVAPASAPAVLFFGGSVTFGEGLDDQEAMPYRVGARLGDSRRVYNFGFHGYGPHQMLAALEHHLVESVVRGPVGTVVYQAIPAHLARAAGRAPWDRRGPWYRLDEQGRVRYEGRFDDRLGSSLLPTLERSLVHRRAFGHERGVDPSDVALVAGIVARAREECARRFPGSTFAVLLWGKPDDPAHRGLASELTRRGIEVHPVRKILPRYTEDPLRYQIGAFDAHPNARAQDLIARYVVEHILGASP